MSEVPYLVMVRWCSLFISGPFAISFPHAVASSRGGFGAHFRDRRRAIRFGMEDPKTPSCFSGGTRTANRGDEWGIVWFGRTIELEKLVRVRAFVDETGC